MLNKNSVLRKLLLKKINLIDSFSTFRFLMKIIKKLRKYGIKERSIALILKDFFEEKYWKSVHIENVWIQLSPDEYKIERELIDPELRVFLTSLHIKVPLFFVKKSYVNFWSISYETISLTNFDINSTQGKGDDVFLIESEFLTIVKINLGLSFKLIDLRKLLKRIHVDPQIAFYKTKLKKEIRISENIRTLSIDQTNNTKTCNYLFNIIRKEDLHCVS